MPVGQNLSCKGSLRYMPTKNCPESKSPKVQLVPSWVLGTGKFRRHSLHLQVRKYRIFFSSTYESFPLLLLWCFIYPSALSFPKTIPRRDFTKITLWRSCTDDYKTLPFGRIPPNEGKMTKSTKAFACIPPPFDSIFLKKKKIIK